MVSGYNSALKKTRERMSKMAKDRKSNNRCVKCNSLLGRYKTYCDFCHLRNEINAVKKTQKRILRILTEFCPNGEFNKD